MMYAHYNYFKIHDRARGGMILPKYRHYENLTFSLVESCMYGQNKYFDDNRGKGVIPRKGEYLSRAGLRQSFELAT